MERNSTEILRCGQALSDEPSFWQKHAVRLTAFPPEGPFERWELVAELSGEILATGTMPFDEEAVRVACQAFHQRVDAESLQPRNVPMGYSDDFMEGFSKATAMAEKCVQQARTGEADGDLRCIAFRIRGLSPADDLSEP